MENQIFLIAQYLVPITKIAFFQFLTGGYNFAYDILPAPHRPNHPLKS